MKVLILSRYGPQGASSRMRFYQFLPWLEAEGIECVVSPLLGDSTLLARYQSGGYGLRPLLAAYRTRVTALWHRRRFDLVWIEKEALPWVPAWFEKWLLRGIPYVMDFDDAIFHGYDLHPSPWVRRVFGRRIDRLMAGASLVVAGNGYLARRARAAGAPWVEQLSTVVDLERYQVKRGHSPAAPGAKPRIVWIGSPSTAQYLSLIAKPLALLAQEQPFILRVIGGGAVSMPGVEVEVVPWSLETEAAAIAECDAGVMPLMDTPWEQGKCAYKLIQYMACGLPTVASTVGANCEVVVEGETGFLSDTPDSWIDALRLLLRDSALRQRLGAAGRARAEAEFCLQRAAPKLSKLLKKAWGG
ncbi:glycosyltransferase family 4 protein [Paraburkholderia caledonica]|uniref:glycosyltransferase family 4 protein n=1 Tax=Paraburkholderia caledonica TaxID=134536 RepID=UPI0004880681|nr:glycosyltransferase family 4 protein [Paraburkholderia caledonica]